MKPRPILALIAAILAHVAFLQAPDQKGQTMLAVYAFAAFCVLAVVFLVLLPLKKLAPNNRPWPTEMLALLAEVIIFIGAGYCTSEGPGVVKLAGVVPLGWTCVGLSLLVSHLALLGRMHRVSPAFTPLGGGTFGPVFRMMMVVLAVVMQGLLNPPWGAHTHDADQFIVGFMICILMILLEATAWIIALKAPSGSRPPAP